MFDLLSAGASLLGGLFKNSSSAKAARKATQANMAEAARDRAFQADQAQQQMAFQERLSSTAHQREILDLKAAGLNPILSGTGGMGASSPTGASGHGSKGSAEMPDISDVVTPAVSTGLSAYRTMQEVKNMEAQNNLLVSQAKNTDADTLGKLGVPDVQKADIAHKVASATNLGAQTEVQRHQADLVIQQLKTEIEKTGNVKADTLEKLSQIPLNHAQKSNLQQLTRSNTFAMPQIGQQTELTTANARMAQLESVLNDRFSALERMIGMGQGATSAVRNLIPSVKINNYERK